MAELIYKRPVESTNEGNLIIKSFDCKAELLNTSVDGTLLHLILTDIDTSEVMEENLTLPRFVENIDGLKEYLLQFNYFYEK